MRSYYDILELSHTASPDEIKKAYRKLAKKFHPDVSNEVDAHDRFVEIEVAYSCLSKIESRKSYDQLLRYKSSKNVNPRSRKRQEEKIYRRESRAKYKASDHAKMTFQQYQKDELLKRSGVSSFIKTILFLGCGFCLLSFYYAFDLIIWEEKNQNWRLEYPFLISFTFVPILILISFAYEPFVDKVIVGSHRKMK